MNIFVVAEGKELRLWFFDPFSTVFLVVLFTC